MYYTNRLGNIRSLYGNIYGNCSNLVCNINGNIKIRDSIIAFNSEIIDDDRDGLMGIMDSELIISGTAGFVNSISVVGTYSLTFNFEDLAHNTLGGVNVNLNIINNTFPSSSQNVQLFANGLAETKNGETPFFSDFYTDFNDKILDFNPDDIFLYDSSTGKR